MTGKGISLKRKWHCPHCEVKVETFVTLNEPPGHRCPKKANRYIELQEKENHE